MRIHSLTRREEHFSNTLSQTPCSTATYFVHTDAELFPDPWRFDPDRWIRAAERGEHLESHLALFLKGNRACLGIKYVKDIASLFHTM